MGITVFLWIFRIR